MCTATGGFYHMLLIQKKVSFLFKFLRMKRICPVILFLNYASRVMTSSVQPEMAWYPGQRVLLGFKGQWFES
jgi:hypothetical protein